MIVVYSMCFTFRFFSVLSSVHVFCVAFLHAFLSLLVSHL